MILRSEQRTTVDKAKEILAKYGIVYLAAQIRTGKTAMALTIANEGVRIKYQRVCFITKKKAISSIDSDYVKLGYKFTKLDVLNFEQVGKLKPEYDLVIVDEAHSIGAYPKPSKRNKEIKKIMGHADVILMSGSPTPESYSQIFNQFAISTKSPFKQYLNFYKWAADFVVVKKKYFNGIDFNDYSQAIVDKIKPMIEPFMVTLSQEEAGFTSFVDEEILVVDINPDLYKLMSRLKKDKVYKMANGKTIICDTPVRMQSVFHQLSSGTIKIDDERIILDRSKAFFIRDKFSGKKIAIFFKFLAEGELLKQVFPNWTDKPEEFNDSNKTFICQMVSGREGINLSSADCLVMYNIDFSATTYWQVRGRMQVKERTIASKIFWTFSAMGIERLIHKAVTNKKSYTTGYFIKDLKLIAA